MDDPANQSDKRDWESHSQCVDILTQISGRTATDIIDLQATLCEVRGMSYPAKDDTGIVACGRRSVYVTKLRCIIEKLDRSLQKLRAIESEFNHPNR